MTPWRSLPPVSQWPCCRGRQLLTRLFFLPALPAQERWLILAFVNYNQTPLCPFHAEPAQDDGLADLGYFFTLTNLELLRLYILGWNPAAVIEDAYRRITIRLCREEMDLGRARLGGVDD